MRARCSGEIIAPEVGAGRMRATDVVAAAGHEGRGGNPIERVEGPAEVDERIAIEARVGRPVLVGRTQRSADLNPLPERDGFQQRRQRSRVRRLA